MDPQTETALAEERRKRAETEAALAEEKRKVAALEAEQRKAAEALQALEEQQREANKHLDAAGMTAPATEAAGTVDAAFGINPLIGFKGTDAFTTGQQLLQQALKQPGMAMKHSTEFFTELGRIWTRNPRSPPMPRTNAFSIRPGPIIPCTRRTCKPISSGIKACMPLSTMLVSRPAMPTRARFVLSLFTQTVAPTNTMLGNPAAMKRFYETGGASAVRSLAHMIEDLAKNGGLPSQVNMKVFPVGKDLALTPGAVVFKNEVVELIQYRPATNQVYQRPLLMVPPQINKFYILDLLTREEFRRIRGEARSPGILSELAQSDSGPARLGPGYLHASYLGCLRCCPETQQQLWQGWFDLVKKIVVFFRIFLTHGAARGLPLDQPLCVVVTERLWSFLRRES